MVAGLAAAIRASTESETIDLGGHSVSSISTIIENAFTEPFHDLDTMIRLTFLVGAGKQGRQKYEEGASRAVTSKLDQLGFVNDRGASCILESAGSYKLQHDTGKNLKTVVVFPKVSTLSSQKDSKADEDIHEDPLLPPNSPGFKLAVASMNVFEKMVPRECPSWSQKRACLDSLSTLQSVISELDTQLMQGTPLSSREQEFYDAVSLLGEKSGRVKELLAEHVEGGTLTLLEKQVLLQHNAERIDALEKQGKPLEKALARKRHLESIVPQAPHPLKHHDQISKVYKELGTLQQTIASSKGRLMSVKESKANTRRDELFEELESLEANSRGWFEEDDVFEARVQASRTALESRYKLGNSSGGSNKKAVKGSVSGTSGGGGGKAEGAIKWVTPSERFSKHGKSSGNQKKKKNSKGEGLFQSVVMDSSSDEDEDENRNEATKATNHPSAPLDAKAGKAPGKAKKKKSKKKKSNTKMDDDETVLTEALARTQQASVEDKQAQTALGQLFGILQDYILPFLSAVIAWLIGLIFGKPKKRKRG